MADAGLTFTNLRRAVTKECSQLVRDPEMVSIVLALSELYARLTHRYALNHQRDFANPGLFLLMPVWMVIRSFSGGQQSRNRGPTTWLMLSQLIQPLRSGDTNNQTYCAATEDWFIGDPVAGFVCSRGGRRMHVGSLGHPHGWLRKTYSRLQHGSFFSSTTYSED
jgi:hypothetical protein